MVLVVFELLAGGKHPWPFFYHQTTLMVVQ